MRPSELHVSTLVFFDRSWLLGILRIALLICISIAFPPPAEAQSQGSDTIEDFTLAAPSNTKVLTEVGTVERLLSRGTWTEPTQRTGSRRFELFAEIPLDQVQREISISKPTPSSGITPSGLGLDTGSEARPYVVKYACCDETELFQSPAFDAAIVGTATVGTEVWVFDLFGAGLPNGLSSCANVPVPCPHLWAEVFSNDLGRSGFMPLTALFDRPPIGEVGRTQFEVGFGRINEGLAAGLRENVIRPEACGDPGTRISFVPSDFGFRDQYFGLGSTELQSCQFLIDRPLEGQLFSCAEFDEDHPLFNACVFQTLTECRSGQQPERQPGSGNFWCSITGDTVGSGTCSDCREWYDNTGQSNGGWQTETQLVDACRAELEVDGNTCSDVNCVDFCQSFAQTEMTAACQRYLGPTDEKWFGDPEDYECGELPLGQTHWGYSQSTAQEHAEWGEADFEWKLLDTWRMPNPKISVTDGELFDPILVPVRIGRLGGQRPVSFDVMDLTSGGRRAEDAGAALNPIQFWFNLVPRPKRVEWEGQSRQLDVLEVSICAFLQGNTADLGSVRFNQNEAGLFSVVQEVDLGVVDFDQIDLCITTDVIIDPDVANVNLESVDAINLEVTNVRPGNPRISGQSITPGLASILPGFDVWFQPFFSAGTALLEFFDEFDTSIEQRFLGYLLRSYSEEVADALQGRLGDVTEDALENARSDVRQSLSDVCTDLAPAAPPGHPFQHFYRWVTWNCEGIARENAIRPFLPNEASADAGCYDPSRFFTPADAGRQAWWTTYAGQTWYWAGFPDSGCRLAFEVQANPDRAVWRPLRCATHVFNAWLNNGPVAGGRAVMVANGCGAHGETALADLYGTNADLEELYVIIHPPNPVQPFGELEIE